MNDIIFEKHNGETVTIVIDGVGYRREVVDNWTSDDLAEIRDGLLLKCQKEFNDRKCSIYNEFQPYISKAVEKETRIDKKCDLAQTIRQMPKEDVIAVFTIYFDELLNTTNGDDLKND